MSLNPRQLIAILAGVATLATCAAAQAPPQPLHLQQGWSDGTRRHFYNSPQGSHLLDYRWFLALESPDHPVSFASDLTRYGYLPNPDDPTGLPIGLVRDADSTGEWLGLTCAACHTAQIQYGGQTIQVDGGPAGADLFGFLGGVRDALIATSSDAARFDRFAGRVLPPGPNPAARAALQNLVARRAREWDRFIAASTPTAGSEWGPARADAFGMIFNRVASIDLGIAQNSQRPNAPVSYPCLWDTTWHDTVQWNGSAPNELEIERLGRNVGEVLGVFARLDLKRPGLLDFAHAGYASSVKFDQLWRLEEDVSHLTAPAWPEGVLGPIDQERRRKGEAIYRDRCLKCHPLNQPGIRMHVGLYSIKDLGTDSTMATVALTRTVRTGDLAGVRQPPLLGPQLHDPDLVFSLVSHAVVGSIERIGLPGLLTYAPNPKEALGLFVARRRTQLQAAYKARPLDGVWATAPYLHNGSVATLWDLLLPQEQRPAQIWVGSRDFDPVHVGFVASPGSGFLLDTTKLGNSNRGHSGPTYGTDLGDEERRDLIEYLKGL